MKKKKVAILLIGMIFGIGISLWDHGVKQWKRSAPEGAAVKTVEISRGSSIQAVGEQLRQGGWLRSKLEWRLFCLMNDCDKIKAGRYSFADREGLNVVFQELIRGHEVSKKVTIPEGQASWEIFSILKMHYSSLDSAVWEQAVHSSTFAAELGIDGSSLEGYLFPDTYQLPWEADEKQLLKFLVGSFDKVWSRLDTTDSPVLRKHGKRGVVTLASIVEEESATPTERGAIAGVFWNRLQQGISLGADPTVRFVFRTLDGPIYQSQLNSDSPYNTRKFRGLPPGPISNPGKEALRAALFPESTKNLYFVAKDDGSREHFFSKTLAEHNRYKEIAAHNRGAGRKR